jgi:hypothetical protein
MTDDEIISLGDYSASLREHPHFITLIRQFELQTVTHFLSTDTHESKKREGIYASLSGFRDFLGNMNAIIDEAARIVAKNKPAPSEYDAPIQEED